MLARWAVLLDEQGCAPGHALSPWVHYGPGRITLTYHVRPQEGNFFCEGREPLRVALELEEPVGARALVDGGAPTSP